MTTLSPTLSGPVERAVAPPPRSCGTGVARPSPRSSHVGRWCIAASVVVHAVLFAVLGRFAVAPAPRPVLEFQLEVAGAAESVAPPETEPVPEPVPQAPQDEMLVEAARPTDEPVPEELPDLEAQPEAAPPEWTAAVPSVTARVRPPTPPESPPPPPLVVAAASSPPPPPPPAASAGAAHVERASPLASNRRPANPTESRRRGEEGTVVLLLSLGADGAIAQVAIEASSGFPRLDEAAVAAAWGWRFRPARADGMGVPSVARQRVAFRLDVP